MEIFQTFGLNLWLLIAEVANFLIVFFVLKKFLYKPLFEMLQKRENTIKEGLKNADKGKELLTDAEEKSKEIHKKAVQEATMIVANARNEAHEIVAKARTQAKKQTDIMIKDAQDDIDRSMREMESKLMNKIATIMSDFVEKATDNLFGPKEQEQLVENALKQFKKLYE